MKLLPALCPNHSKAIIIIKLALAIPALQRLQPRTLAVLIYGPLSYRVLVDGTLCSHYQLYFKDTALPAPLRNDLPSSPTSWPSLKINGKLLICLF